jgi:ABC-type multidrug transport system fused ATPase/permease subunit
MLFWLIGDLSGATRGGPGLLALAGVLGVAMFFARDATLLSRGDLTAASLGVSVRGTSLALHALAAFATAVAVTQAGSVGFVGLVVPHAVRLVIGNDQRWLMPAAALAGGALLTLADTAARTLFAPGAAPGRRAYGHHRRAVVPVASASHCAMTSAPPILSCRDLALAVPGRTLCSDVAFDVRAGECWIVAGRNGAGKTTLLQTLAGLRRRRPALSCLRVVRLPSARRVGARSGSVSSRRTRSTLFQPRPWKSRSAAGIRMFRAGVPRARPTCRSPMQR